MAYTSHGHQIPGTPVEGPRPESVARCGGPGRCKLCSLYGKVRPQFIAKLSFKKTGSNVMELKTFVRKPFSVEAIEITEDNIAELAPLIGALKEKEDGTPYIQVDRKKVPNIYRVFPGFWMTKMDKNIRCYSNKIFHEQFTESTGTVKEAVEMIGNSHG
jgi:hypothetical protein